MGYTKTWTPPVVVIRNDLEVWKTLFKDITDNLVEAGLVQTDDPGQLVFDEVTELPADNTMAGFQIYRFNDSLQATCPIFIKLEFGCGGEATAGSNNSRPTMSPKIRANVIGNQGEYLPVPYALFPGGSWPDTSAGGTANVNTVPGISYSVSNEAQGFFGFFYGCGGRTLSVSGTGAKTGSLLLVIQRDLDSNGIPQDTGFNVWFPTAVRNNIITTLPSYYHISNNSPVTSFSQTSLLRPLSNLTSVVSTGPQLHPIAMLDGAGRVVWTPNMFTFVEADINNGHIFEASPGPGLPERTFLALHADNFPLYDPYGNVGLAILWE